MDIDVEAANAYNIDRDSLMNWRDYDGLEAALNKHDESVALRLKHDGHIYFFGGSGPFEELMRWSVLDLNNTAKRSTMMILKRTAYFASLGLFSLDDKMFAEFACQGQNNPSYNIADFRSIKCNVSLGVNQILHMDQYRLYKASQLLRIRRVRNEARSALKASYSDYLNSPVDYALKQVELAFSAQMKDISQLSGQLASNTLIKTHNLFDSSGMSWVTHSTYRGYLNYLFSFLNDMEVFHELFPKPVIKQLKNDIVLRQQANVLRQSLQQDFFDAVSQGVEEFCEFIQAGNAGLMFGKDVENLPIDSILAIKECYQFGHQQDVTFTLSDVPAAASIEIEW